MILYGLLVKNEALGSTDGFNILPSTLFGIRPAPRWVRYAVLASAAAVSLVAALLVHRYLRTPLGRLAPAIKDNEIRVEYMGALRAARGAREVRDRRGAGRRRRRARRARRSATSIRKWRIWTTSGEFIFITILAGTGSVVAPFAGALLYGAIHTTAYDLSPNTWQTEPGHGAASASSCSCPRGSGLLFQRRRWRVILDAQGSVQDASARSPRRTR